MKNKIFIIALILALLVPGLIFAQRSTGGRTRVVNYTLTIQCNVRGANIQMDKIEGTKDDSFRGNAPFSQTVTAGSYNINVSADGYDSQSRVIEVSSDQTVNFTLIPSKVNLRISSNVPVAQVQVQGPDSANGRVTFNQALTKGNYRITVSASGYNTVTRNVNLSSDQNLTINLTPSTGTVNFIIPTDFLDMRNGNPTSLVEVYVDGQKQSNNRTVTMRPGRHTIRLSSGAFNVQKVLDIQAGQVYDFQLVMDLQLSVGK